MLDKLVYVLPIIVCIFVYLGTLNASTTIKDIIHNNSDIRIDGKNSDVVIHNEDFYGKLLTKGELGLAESYMDGDWSTKDLGGLLYKLLKYQDVFEDKIRNKTPQFIYFAIKYKCQQLFNTNTVESGFWPSRFSRRGSSDNITKHYDIGDDLYGKMLGKTWQYSCGYYNEPDIDLDQAELNKMELVAKKLGLKPGMTVLDIGCGWGVMAYHLVTKYDVTVLGVTLSENQVKYAKEHYKHPNLNIMYQDYRTVTGKFDRVFSVGMFEHVGSGNYKDYFNKCDELLTDDGIMFLHTMAIAKPKPNQRGWFASTYIFPEGELPDIYNLTSSFGDTWRLEDFQNFGISYSKTFDAWRNNIGDWSGLDNYDPRFRRMWKYYLHLFAENFRYQNFLLWQLVYTKKKHTRKDDCLFIRT